MSKRFEITVRILLYIHSCCFFCYICLFNIKWSGVLLVIILNSTFGYTAALFNNSEGYNIANNPNTFQSTLFDTEIFNYIGIKFVRDTVKYDHYYTVGQDGIYLVIASINFDDRINSTRSLYGRLERNSNIHYRQVRTIGKYTGADYIFCCDFKKNDEMRFKVLQNGGDNITTSNECKLIIIKL